MNIHIDVSTLAEPDHQVPPQFVVRYAYQRSEFHQDIQRFLRGEKHTRRLYDDLPTLPPGEPAPWEVSTEAQKKQSRKCIEIV